LGYSFMVRASQEKQRLAFLIGLLGPITTLIVSPFLNLDPINPIKVLVVSTIAGGCLGIILGIRFIILQTYSKVTLTILLGFPVFSLVAFLASDSNKEQQFFGVYGRNSGLLSYLALFVILFASGLLERNRIAYLVLIGLRYSSLLMLLYCLIQIAKLDPVKWSAFAPFGTLGNVNFSSAFLGLSAVAVGLHTLSQKLTLTQKFLLGIYLLASLFVIYRTGSIQGLLVFFLGYWVALTSWIYIRKQTLTFILWLISSLIFFYLSVLGFLQRGPLSAILYQETNTFRFDYWHAGIEMINKKPILGHGFEAYGDLYTQERGLISALRTGLGRTSNSAHNIFLDIGVNGGIILLLVLLTIFSIALINSIRYLQVLRMKQEVNLVFLALFSFWIAYMAQALISINQIGVGVWAWIITGILLGWKDLTYGAKEDFSKKVKAGSKVSPLSRPSSQKHIGALSAIFGLIFTTVGFSAGYIPVSTDAAFRKASDNASLNEMIDASNAFGANNYFSSRTVQAAIQSNYPDQALQLTEKMIREFPEDSYAWKIRGQLGNTSPSERERALKKILELDPFFACATPDPVTTFKSYLLALPSEKQLELAKWWRLASDSDQASTFSLTNLPGDSFDQKLLSFC
jgi:O-antigen ligase